MRDSFAVFSENDEEKFADIEAEAKLRATFRSISKEDVNGSPEGEDVFCREIGSISDVLELVIELDRSKRLDQDQLHLQSLEVLSEDIDERLVKNFLEVCKRLGIQSGCITAVVSRGEQSKSSPSLSTTQHYN